MSTDQRRSQTKLSLPDEQQPADGAAAPGAGFGSEFRELARQRRFQRRTDEVIQQSRAQAAQARAPHRLRQDAGQSPAPAPRAAAAPHAPAAPTYPPAAPPQRAAAPSSYTAAAGAYATERERLTDTARGVVSEMSRMADRIIEAREAVAVERSRANRAERDLAAANDRIMAARALVHEAQRTARAAAERCAYLEGRCEALEDSLDTALAGSWMARWRHRRHERATS